jgi:hypothetical protein
MAGRKVESKVDRKEQLMVAQWAEWTVCHLVESLELSSVVQKVEM